MGQIPGQTPAADNKSTADAPQNDYRSYQPESVFQDQGSWNSDRVAHERLSQEAMIARANGGSPQDTSEVGRFVDDSNL